MKKVILKAVILLSMFSVFLMPVMAEAAALTVDATAPQSQGATVIVPISLAFGAEAAVASVQFDVTYDNTILTYNGVITAGVESANADKDIAANETSPGVIRVIIVPSLASILSGNPVLSIADGVIADISFTVQAGAPGGNTPLTLSNYSAAEYPSLNAISLTVTNGNINITAPETNQTFYLSSLSSIRYETNI